MDETWNILKLNIYNSAISLIDTWEIMAGDRLLWISTWYTISRGNREFETAQSYYYDYKRTCAKVSVPLT